jgi:ADP-dependent NAD(P)H-hydrate dehydratase / NAD(P)H-hydrate epimerase
MRPLLSPRQMAEADSATIDSGTPAHVLMDRAGRAVARAVVRVAGGRYGKKVVVVCGKGNNGGDGFVAARVLANEGLNVVCTDAGAPFEPEGPPFHHLQAMRRAGVELRAFDAAHLDDADVVVDAIFGTGFRGAVEGDVAKTIDAIVASPAAVVAVDIPSGVNGTTGAVEGSAVRAALTVAIAAEKLGTALAPGAEYAGVVEVEDIGIEIPSVKTQATQSIDAAAALPRRATSGHKRSNGSVAVLAGSVGMSGAALLCCQGAMRMGAGYVTLGTTVEVARAADVVVPEVLKRALWDGNGMSVVALERFADVLERADALAIGPGLRDKPGQRALVHRVLETVELPIVLDADGLNVLEGDTEPLRARPHSTVITPHPGELARLIAPSAAEIQKDRLGSALRAAEELDCTVLLKGSRTVVAAPGGEAVVVTRGGPELATAGSGDVLCGVAVTLLAQGLEPFEAAWAGAYIHGLAGELAGRALAGRGVVAWDVAETLPEALAELAPLS